MTDVVDDDQLDDEIHQLDHNRMMKDLVRQIQTELKRHAR